MIKPLAFPLEDLDFVLSKTADFWSRFSGARLFMTGGTGFIGSWLLQVLQRANDTLASKIDIVVLSRDPARVRQQLPHIFDRADTTLLAGEVSNFTASLGKLDLCIHAATDVGDPSKLGDPLKLFGSIVLGTRQVLELAQTSGVSHFLLASSGAIYGPQPTDVERIAETYTGAPDPLQPSNAYGNGKRMAEWLTCAYAEQAGFAACIARIFALLGPGLPLNGPFAAGNFVSDILAGQAIQIAGDGTPLRSYLYMADLCVWLLRLLGFGTTGQAYNVGSEQAVSVAELAKNVVQVSGENLPIEVKTSAISTALPPRYVPATAKARSELGLAEYTPLDVALFKTMQWSRATGK